VDYAIHAPVVPGYHGYVLSLEELLIESEGDYEERESVIRQTFGLAQCGLVEDG